MDSMFLGLRLSFRIRPGWVGTRKEGGGKGEEGKIKGERERERRTEALDLQAQELTPRITVDEISLE